MTAAFQQTSLKTIRACIIIDSEGNRILSKYYGTKISESFEKKLFEKTRKNPNNDIIMLDRQLVLYKSCGDVFIYIVANSPFENEIMLFGILNSFYDALVILLKNQVEKRIILGNLDLILLAIDETIDDGIVLELDSSNIASRVSKRTDRDNVPLSEQTLSQALRSAQETIARSLLK